MVGQQLNDANESLCILGLLPKGVRSQRIHLA